MQGSARLFVGPLVPRSLPLLLFQQSQYLAWIRACLLVVYKFSCRRTTNFFLFFFYSLFLSLFLLEISVVQTFPRSSRRREDFCHSLRPLPCFSDAAIAEEKNRATHLKGIKDVLSTSLVETVMNEDAFFFSDGILTYFTKHFFSPFPLFRSSRLRNGTIRICESVKGG